MEVKSMLEIEKDNTRGIAVGGLTTGIIGSALGLLNGGAGNILGGWGNNCGNGPVYVSRYEADQAARIAELETEVKLRDANTYTLSEMNRMRNYVDGKFDAINAQLCQQAVVNAQVTANISCMQNTLNTLSGLTKTVIPIGNVCPEPMARYNSWTAPTADAAAGA
jgi:hypothetical protein